MALLRGKLLAGALFAGALFGVVQQAAQVEHQAGGHWKHLFRPIQAVEAHALRLRSSSRYGVELPVTYDIRQSVEAPPVAGKANSYWTVSPPSIGTYARKATARATCTLHVAHPKCAGSAFFLHGAGSSYANIVAPSAASHTALVHVRSRAFYTFVIPRTIQNPTMEMLFELLR